MSSRLRRGFTLVELLVAMAIGLLLLLMAMPGYVRWVADAEILNGAESIANGLREAQADAIARNLNVQFVLAGGGWAVQMADPPNATLTRATFQEGSRNATVVGVDAGGLGATTVAFSALGQVLPNATNLVQIDVTEPAVAGTRPLRIIVGNGRTGVKICDPLFANPADPKACP